MRIAVSKVQFISSKPIKEYGTTQLRCLQPASYLRKLGFDVSVGNIRDVQPISNGVIFFHRTSMDRFSRAYGNLARSRGNVLVYDTDDLTFNDEVGTNFLELCDAVSVSTDYLQQRCSSLHPDVHVIRNALSDDFFSLSNEVFEYRKAHRSEYVTIGYFSGSPTHDEDFLEVQNILLELLLAFPNLRVIIAGKLSFSSEFNKFGERFIYHSFLPYYEYINLYRDVDVNIAPLNVESDHANGKSELKFMEAGACGIPTIASPTDTYSNIISCRKNGLLARTAREWKLLLEELIADVALRNRLGTEARTLMLSNYTEMARANHYACFIENVKKRYNRSPKRVPALVYMVMTKIIGVLKKPSPASIHN